MSFEWFASFSGCALETHACTLRVWSTNSQLSGVIGVLNVGVLCDTMLLQFNFCSTIVAAIGVMLVCVRSWDEFVRLMGHEIGNTKRPVPFDRAEKELQVNQNSTSFMGRKQKTIS